MAPSTFASAAAGHTQNNGSSRDTSSEWPRRTNGATQTFRRPSGAINALATPASSETLSSANPPRYVPPHRNGTILEARYGKDQLLDLYKAQTATDGVYEEDVSTYFIGGWQPELANGALSGWGRTEQNRDAPQGPEICWVRDGSVEPLGLYDMDDEERELFTSSVNTTIKPPPTNTKDGQQANGLSGRKASISHSNVATPGFGLPSPSVTRGTGRRRETSESYPFPSNPIGSPSTAAFPRDEQTSSPPPSLLRRRTDLKDVNKPEDRDKSTEEGTTASPFGTLKRHPTGPLSGGFGAPASPWSTGPQSAGLAPMGSFGSFGLGGSSSQQSAIEKRSGLSGGRAESRFKNVLSKDLIEDGGRTLETQNSVSSLSRVNENESWRASGRDDVSEDVGDDHEIDLPTGSAALAADADVSPPQPRPGYRGFGTPSRQHTQQDDFGFGAFGMTSDNAHGFGQGFLQNRETFQQTPAHLRAGQSMGGNHEPMSPTGTNPYQSPEQHGLDRLGGSGHDGDDTNSHLPGLGGLGGEPSQLIGGLASLKEISSTNSVLGVPVSGHDRSQNSSVGPSRGFPGLGGFGSFHGGMPGSNAWPQGGLGTPGRQSASLANPFGSGVFAPLGDLQSPGLAGLGTGHHAIGQHGYGGSRMASMFPPSIQEQLRIDEREAAERGIGQRFGAPGEGGAEQVFGGSGASDSATSKSQQDPGEAVSFGAPGQQSKQAGSDAASATSQNQSSTAPSSSQPPAPQQRTMVMPDRMRWIYRDPQGQTQGPWSGLEMHDWYKAGFFSPELLVKKYEDPDYEPLAQLIRRIGNSREPFLVPQIGIPHGPPTNNASNAWPASSTTGTAGSGGAQPPFASSFPSFGTTLTADQQNALERRKQEEQYLMARQKEHLAQAQIASRMQMQGAHGLMAHQLQHHGSAHSLHSQPSFGSMTSPAGYQNAPGQGPANSHVPGFFDNSFRAQPGLGPVGAGVDNLGHIREEEHAADRFNAPANRSYGAPGQQFTAQHQQAPQLHGQDPHEQQVRQMLQDRARLDQEQAEHDVNQQGDDLPKSDERLQQFRQLQSQATVRDHQQPQQPPSSAVQQPARQLPQEPLSLTEQVQKAASAKQSPAPQQPGLPQPFPPPPSQSPLPAPAAQRTGRQSVADQLQTESRDLSQTPSSETPSAAIAPWAKEPAEAARGPSLKEIQEAEAKKAAEAEELAAAARRAAFQKELEAQAAAAIPAPGLPAASTWATGSPATPTGVSSAAWAKTAQKPLGPAAAKSMAQIQKEEEARKKKLAAAAAASAQQQVNVMGGVASPAGGKSYANLAGKISTPATAPGGAWTTVGAGGKAKTPIVPGAPATLGARTVSAGVVPILPAASVVGRKPAAPTRSVTMSGGVNAQDEFRKWAVNELRPDLNKGINADDFIANLVVLPPDTDMITEAVHSVSNTIDSRHFAEEFLRRKKLADKGLIDPSLPPKSASPAGLSAEGKGSTGGWSEVAKKGPAGAAKDALAKDDVGANGSFRVVAGRKKGAKR